jgi:hypothetical protein
MCAIQVARRPATEMHVSRNVARTALRFQSLKSHRGVKSDTVAAAVSAIDRIPFGGSLAMFSDQ